MGKQKKIKVGITVVIMPKKKGQKELKFKKGGLHKSLGVKGGENISGKKFKEALAGKKGAKAKKQAQFAKNVLTGRKKK